MAHKPHQQFNSFLEQAQHVLILLPENPHGDAIGAGWALAHLCTQRKKEATVAFSDLEKNAAQYDFLVPPPDIRNSLSGTRDMLLSFKTKHNNITDVRTERSDDSLDIYITPQRGMIDPRDFSFMPAAFPYDIIITCGAQDKDTFGALHEQCPDLFYEVPLINIDNSSANERFAQTNIIDVTASSVSEVIFDLISEKGSRTLEDTVAECLLTGIISATDSFQNKNTTPRSLRSAGKLIDYGADQQKIIKNMYKTQPLPLLKLWGRVMSTMHWDERHKLVWTTVTRDDFRESGATASDCTYILEKLRANYTAGKIFLLLFEEEENSDHISGLVDFSRLDGADALCEQLSAKRGKGAYSFVLKNTTLADAEQKVLGVIRA